MEGVLDFLAALGVSLLFVITAWGIILRNTDEQKLYDARQDYNKMRDNLKDAEKNESSRIG